MVDESILHEDYGVRVVPDTLSVLSDPVSVTGTPVRCPPNSKKGYTRIHHRYTYPMLALIPIC